MIISRQPFISLSKNPMAEGFCFQVTQKLKALRNLTDSQARVGLRWGWSSSWGQHKIDDGDDVWIIHFLFEITFVGALSAIKTDDSDDNDLELKKQLTVIRCEW